MRAATAVTALALASAIASHACASFDESEPPTALPPRDGGADAPAVDGGGTGDASPPHPRFLYVFGGNGYQLLAALRGRLFKRDPKVFENALPEPREAFGCVAR